MMKFLEKNERENSDNFTRNVPDCNEEDDLRSVGLTLGHDAAGDVEGREVWRRRDVVMHGDLQKTHDMCDISVVNTNTVFVTCG